MSLMGIISAAVAALCIIIWSVRYFQILQLNGYDEAKFFGWLGGKGFAALLSGILLAAAAIIADLFGLRVLLFMPVTAAAGFFALYKIPSKVKLKATKRIARLEMSVFVLTFAAALSVMYCGAEWALYILLAASPAVVAAVNRCLKPLERSIANSYISRAKAKLERISPVKIAVTGSYGKTTVKNMLSAMLSKRYRVCASPESYNTPSGISITVNDVLSESDEIFIAEMGARKTGDIAFLTQMVMPDIAVITAVGNQHLETFGSLENVIKAKSELPENLPCGGRAYFNGDSPAAKHIYDCFGGNKILTGKKGTVRYENVAMSVKGTEFDLVAGKEREHMFTRLAGRHIPAMICLAAAVSLSLGISINEIKNAVLSLQPVAHRLQLMYNGNDVIIDDSFSSNEAGFVSAAEVLSQFSYLIKVIITPGVVELGKYQFETNYRLGAVAAKSCDYLIAIGKNARALKNGALSAGLSPRCIAEAGSRAEAMEHYKKIAGSKAVLFENDLPDNYE